MADYAILQNLTQNGLEIMQSNPDISNNLVVQVDAHTKIVTGGNYGIESSFVNYVAEIVIYDIKPLTSIAQMEMQQASLGIPSLAFLDTMKNIMAYAVTIGSAIIAGLVTGAVAGGVISSAIPIVGTAAGAAIGAVVGAGLGLITGLSISLFSYLDQTIQLENNRLDNQDDLNQMLEDGTITQEQWETATEANQSTMEEPKIPWTKFITYGMVGVGALAALYIFLKTK